MALVQGDTPPGSQYGITGSDWLQSLARGLGGVYQRPMGQGVGPFQNFHRLLLQQNRANKEAGYAPQKPAQALMDWVKKWLTEQEKIKMEAIMPEPEKEEAQVP